jgi:DNA-binding MarR family transcriptional regulator
MAKAKLDSSASTRSKAVPAQRGRRRPSVDVRRVPASDTLDALRYIVRELRLGSHVAEKGLGLSGAQLYVLQQIGEHPNAALKDIAHATLTDQSSVSVVVSRLVERGLVLRKVAADDARRAELSLSAAGRRVLARATEVPPQVRLIAALQKLPPKEIAALGRSLTRILREMDIEVQAPATSSFEADEATSTARRPRRRAARS